MDSFIGCSVILAAGGLGTRMNSNINKQYIEIDGIPILARTINCFENCELVNEIILVVSDIEQYNNEFVNRFDFTKVKTIVLGGKTRQESVFNGIQAISNNSNVILVHDGARPFVSNKIIKESISSALEYGASCVGVPTKDTIKLIESDGFVQKTLQRNLLWSIQTPQTFEKNILINSHNLAIKNEYTGTDDCSLVEYAGHKVKMIMGDYFNIKITTPEDLVFAEMIAKIKNEWLLL